MHQFQLAVSFYILAFRNQFGLKHNRKHIPTCFNNSKLVYFINIRVELTLCKKEEEEVWSQVVVGDNRGEMTMDPALIAQIHERLAGLTSDQLVSVSPVSTRDNLVEFSSLIMRKRWKCFWDDRSGSRQKLWFRKVHWSVWYRFI